MSGVTLSEKSTGWVARLIVPVVILALCGAGTAALVSRKPKAKEKEPDVFVQSVRVAPVRVQEHPRRLEAPGLVMPSRSVTLAAPVAAEIEWVRADLGPGARVEEGEVLFKLERAELQIALERAENAVAQAEQRAELERGQRSAVESEWEAYARTFPGEGDGPGRPSALALREPQLKLVELERERAEVDVKRARLDLSRARVRAPFDAMVRAALAARGQRVAPGTPLVELVATDTYWVEASVPLDRLDLVAAGAASAVVLQASSAPRPAKLLRLVGEVDQATRMARALFAVERPLEGAGPELLLGARVAVMLESTRPARGAAVPRGALYEDGHVFVVDDEDRLERVEVEVEWRRGEDVIVTGLTDGQRLVVSPLAAPAPGAKLRVLGGDGDG